MLYTIKNAINKLMIKSHILIIGSLLIIIGISFIIYDNLKNYKYEKKEQELIQDFFVNETNNIDETDKQPVEKEVYKQEYIAVIEIPSISLKNGLVDSMSKSNNVNEHIEILKSDMPNVINGNFALAGHSGTGRIAYFKNLIKVKINDNIYIYYNSIKYNYKVINIYNQEKNGIIDIYRDPNKTTITLTTCHNYDNKQQLVVIGELIEKNTY